MPRRAGLEGERGRERGALLHYHGVLERAREPVPALCRVGDCHRTRDAAPPSPARAAPAQK